MRSNLPRALFFLPFAAAIPGGCAAPISTIRSPAHPRVVEVRNATDEERLLEIEPAAHQRLGASTTFTGRLRPRQTKVLYLYDGFTYRFRLASASSAPDVRQDIRIESDLALAYGGDSLVATGPRVEVGQPVLVGSPAYEGATEQDLDRLARQLAVFLTPAERAALRAAPLEGKRQLLVEFWARRDPTPGTPRNEFREGLEARLAVAEREFGRTGEPGAETPRGRIYLRYGKPDRVVSRALSTQTDYPYEIWQYFTTGRTYVFLDELRNGRFVLLTSTDPDEPGRPDWQARLPSEALEELGGHVQASAGPSDLAAPETRMRGGVDEGGGAPKLRALAPRALPQARPDADVRVPA